MKIVAWQLWPSECSVGNRSVFVDEPYMSRATKDPIVLGRVALEAGRETLPVYSCPRSPHEFTQAQLFSLLILKQFFKLD